MKELLSGLLAGGLRYHRTDEMTAGTCRAANSKKFKVKKRKYHTMPGKESKE
jgi:hypothetical protein